MLRFLSGRGFPHIARAARLVRLPRRGDGRDARRRAGVRPRRARRLGARARRAGQRDPDRLLGELRDLGGVLGELHTALGSDARRPGLRPRASSPRAWTSSSPRSTRRSATSSCDLPEATSGCAPIARPRRRRSRERLRVLAAPGRAWARRSALHGDLHLGQTLLDGDGALDDPRLRGRARAPAARAPPQALAAARRRRHAALVRLRRRGGARWTASSVPDALGGSGARGAPGRVPRRASTAALLPARRRRRPTRCCAIFELEKAVYELRYELQQPARLGRDPGRRHPRAPARGASRHERPPSGLDALARAARTADPHAYLGAHPRRAAASWSARSAPARTAVVAPASTATRPSQLEHVHPAGLFEGRARRRRGPAPLRARGPLRRRRAGVTAARPVPLPADARRARPAPRRRGPPRASCYEQARRARRERRRRATGVAFAVWAPNARVGERRRRLQRAGTGGCTRCARSASSRHLGAVRPRRAARAPLQVRAPHPRRASSGCRPTRSPSRPRCRRKTASVVAQLRARVGRRRRG